MCFNIILACLATLSVLTINYQCELDPSIEARIDQSLAPFADGVTEEMIDKIKGGALCRVKIENGVVDAKCLPSYWLRLFKKFPASLPDM